MIKKDESKNSRIDRRPTNLNLSCECAPERSLHEYMGINKTYNTFFVIRIKLGCLFFFIYSEIFNSTVVVREIGSSGLQIQGRISGARELLKSTTVKVLYPVTSYKVRLDSRKEKCKSKVHIESKMT